LPALISFKYRSSPYRLRFSRPRWLVARAHLRRSHSQRPARSNRLFQLEPFDTSRMNKQCRSHAIPFYQAPFEILIFCGVDIPQPSNFRRSENELKMNWNLTHKIHTWVLSLQVTFSNGARLWRAIYASKGASTARETPTSARQDFWAELRHGTVP
jgi:hypothetical protein